MAAPELLIVVRFQVTGSVERRMVEAAVCIDPGQPLDIGRAALGSVGLAQQSTWGTAAPSRLTHGTLTTPAQPRNLRSVDNSPVLPIPPSGPSRSDETCKSRPASVQSSTDFFKMQFPE